MIDHSKQSYCEVYKRGTGVGFKVYHYDSTGNNEIVIHRSDPIYRDKIDAENAAADWCEANNIDAEMC